MDELQKDLWKLLEKYKMRPEVFILKLEQMIMEHELACESGILAFQYGDTITFVD